MNIKTEVLLGGLKFPEGPRWHEGKLWFSDMDALEVKTVDMDGRAETILKMSKSPSGLGWLPDGRLLVVSMQDRRLLRLDPEGLVEHADLSSLASFHCNDMVVDSKGRAYVGNFGFDFNNQKPFHLAELILITPDGKKKIVAEKLAFPNGSVITPDESTLIVGETFSGKLTAFDINEDGTLANRRVWAKLRRRAVPDGICLDAENGIWVASPTTSGVLRVLEGGKVTDEVKVDTQAYACMLGGPERRTLFIATSDDSRVNGRIETVNVEIPGAGFP